MLQCNVTVEQNQNISVHTDNHTSTSPQPAADTLLNGSDQGKEVASPFWKE